MVVAVLLLGVPGRVAWRIRRREREAGVPLLGQTDQPEASQTLKTDVALPSAVNDYDFQFSATVHWRPTVGATVRHANPSGLAVDAILARAQEITKDEHPSRADVVTHQLAAVLGLAERDSTGAVKAWAEQIQLVLPEVDQVRLRKCSDLRKAWELTRDLKCKNGNTSARTC